MTTQTTTQTQTATVDWRDAVINMTVNLGLTVPSEKDRASWLQEQTLFQMLTEITCVCPHTKQVTLVITDIKDIPLVDVPCVCGKPTCWAIKWLDAV